MAGFLPPPNHPRLGTIDLDVILDWYDGPLLFSARNELGYAHLGLALPGDEYAYIPVSEDRLMAVRTGLIPVREAFARRELSTVFVVAADGAVREVGEFVDDWLPAPDFYLAEFVETASRFSEERLVQMARSQSRPLTALEFEPEVPGNRTEMAIRDTSRLLSEFQELATVTHLEAVRESRSLPPAAVAQAEADVEFSMVQYAAGSVVIVMAPLRGQKMLDVANPSLDVINDLFEAANNPDSLVEAVRQRGRRTTIHLRRFLDALSDASASVTLFDARPAGVQRVTRLPLPSVKQSLEILRFRTELPSVRIPGFGHLVGIDHVRRTFKIKESRPTEGRKTARTFVGSIDAEIASRVEGLPAGLTTPTYRFEIIQDRELSEFDDGEGKKTYRLTAIDDVNQPPVSGL